MTTNWRKHERGTLGFPRYYYKQSDILLTNSQEKETTELERKHKELLERQQEELRKQQKELQRQKEEIERERLEIERRKKEELKVQQFLGLLELVRLLL